MEITLYQNAFDRTPDNLKLSFAELCELFAAYMAQPFHRDDKKGRKAFSFGRCEGSRGNKNMRFLSGVAADIDTAPDAANYLTFGAACDMLEKLGIQFFAYSTTSNSEDHHHFRILLPFDHDVTPEQYPAAWHEVNKRFGNRLDRSTKDLARISFMPAAWHGGLSKGFNDSRYNLGGHPILSVADIKNLSTHQTDNNTISCNGFAPIDLPDLSQGRGLDWTGWDIYMDLKRSPYVSPAFLNDLGSNRAFIFMIRCAGRAQWLGHPITPEILAVLADQFEGQVLNRNTQSINEYVRRAQYALAHVYSNSAAMAQSASDGSDINPQ